MKEAREDRISNTYRYIVEFQRDFGRAPTFREILRERKYKAISSVQDDIIVLKKRGFLSDNGTFAKISLAGNLNISKFHGASIVGRVKCGQPGEAIEDIEDTVALPNSIFGNKEHIILYADGPSMVNAGIFDGDLLVVAKQPTAEIGQIVVALIGDSTTTKYLDKKDGKIYLRASNDNREYDVYPDGDFTIIGVVERSIHIPSEK